MTGAIEKAVASPMLLKVGWDQIKEKVRPMLEAKLADVPPEEIQTPPLMIAGPALEALRFTYEEDELCDLFTSLLATSIDRRTAEQAHPAFVSIISQLTPDEAQIIQYFKNNGDQPVVDLRSVVEGEAGWQTEGRNISHIGQIAKITHLKLCPIY